MPATVWKGYLTFGLVSFPVRLFSAARPETIHFHLLHKRDQSRVKEVWYCAKEDKPIDRDEMVKGYEYAKGRYVVIEDEELKKIAPPTATNMEILQCVRSEEVDPIFFESSYYMAPEANVSKPYVLLLNALKETNNYAIAKVAMHAREHIVVIRPTREGLVLHTVYYPNELHKANAAGKSAKAEFNKKEMDLAKTLLNTLVAPFKPEEFHDQYRENVEHLIEAKRKGKPMEPVEQPKQAPVVDIYEALQRSLQQVKGGRNKAAPAKRKRKAA